MKLKLDANGNVVVENGMPVYVHADGKELAHDAAQTISTIDRLNSEAKGHRIAKETAEAALQRFSGIDDPEAAKKALATVAAMDGKKLLEAGKVEELTRSAVDTAVTNVRREFEPVVAERDKLSKQLSDALIGGSFSGSKYIQEKLLIPADMARAAFGSSFKIEDGKVVALDSNGNPLLSRKNHGTPATFEEALEILVDQYPHKDQILRAKDQSGGGSPQGNGARAPGKKFADMNGTERAALYKEVGAERFNQMVQEDKASRAS